MTTFEKLRRELQSETGVWLSTGVAGFKPNYRDFRAGDVRHSLVDINKAQTFLGYEPSYRIRKGLSEASAWYAQNITRKNNYE